MTAPALVWFRLDLRLDDQPALAAAAARGGVVPIFIWSPEEEGAAAPGGASRWWLHRSLAALDASLRARGSRLIFRRGPALEALRAAAKESGAGAVFWNRRYEPASIARDAAVKEGLRADGLKAESFNSALLFEPWQVKTGAGRPYQVFTPFWKACLQSPEPSAALPVPKRLAPPEKWPKSGGLGDFELQPKIAWDAGLRETWTPGESAARGRLDAFAAGAAGDYHEARDRMGEEGVSRLSPYLHFGEISPRRVWELLGSRAASAPGRGAETFLKELGWREFAHHLLYHFPETVSRPLRPEFAQFPWRRDAEGLAAWKQGRTGYSIVDAGMRQLRATGWMHNRARMIAASFLVKDLLIDWRLGAAWFWDNLVDADLASNTLGWQWTAGCGADAAPFFRVFNPVLQGERFDAGGAYARRWVSERADAASDAIHEPRAPIVDHAAARERALAALSSLSARRPPAGA